MAVYCTFNAFFKKYYRVLGLIAVNRYGLELNLPYKIRSIPSSALTIRISFFRGAKIVGSQTLSIRRKP